MKALVFNDIGDIALKNVPEPTIKDNKDVIVRLTRSAICGTDLHMIRGTMTGMKKGTILGHEGVGVIEKKGKAVHKFKVGDRVIIPSTISCGICENCKKKLFAQCNNANPNGPEEGTAFFGGPESSGPFNGMQAEKVRVPFADTTLIKIPHDITDDQAILLSDIFPTAFMGVLFADVRPHDTVAVFGCGPVGQLVIACLNLFGVKKIFAIDAVESRLKKAHEQGAHPINFDKVDVVKALKKATDKKGVTKVIDAVGIDADQPNCRNCKKPKKNKFAQELKKVAPRTNIQGDNWIPGSGPSQVLRWAVEALAKNGTLSIIGVYTNLENFPIAEAMEKNLTIRMGNCHHRAYIPTLLKLVQKKELDPLPFITQLVPLEQIEEAYKHFDKRDDNWIKVVLVP